MHTRCILLDTRIVRLGRVARTPLAQTSVRDALDSALIALTAAGCDTPRLDAELLLADAMGVDRAAIVSDPGRGLTPEQARRFQSYAMRRVQREPVAYILGTKGFRTIDLLVDGRVLIPRPETEHLVEAALELPHGARVADVGTGSGAVALALKAERPDLEVVATDASPDALAVARANAQRLGLEVALLEGDLLAPVEGRLDAVLSNPPYVADGDRGSLAPDITRHEPPLALFAGEDGLSLIRRLAPQAAATGASMLALEVGFGQAGAVAEIVRGAGFAQTRALADLAGIERVVVGRR
jgi:release factor glutamine methyltransferase